MKTSFPESDYTFSKCLHRYVKFPLWKNKFNEDDIQHIKQILRDKKDFEEYKLDTAICFSEWWRTQYVGGIPSIEKVMNYIGLSYELKNEFYDNSAKLFIKECPADIKIIKKDKNLYFRTLLFQGGFPMKFISGENSNAYKDFLIRLVSNLNDIGFPWDSINTNIIDSFNLSSYLNNFDSDDVRSLSLMIAKAIINEDKNELPFDTNDEQFKDLYESLRNIVLNNKRKTTIKFSWALNISDENQGIWKFTLDLPNEIDIQTINEPHRSTIRNFHITVLNTPIASYRRIGESFRKLRDNKQKLTWRGEQSIEVKATLGSKDLFSLEVKDNSAPEFAQPTILYGVNNNYTLKKSENANNSIIIFDPYDWKAIDSCYNLTINNVKYSYCKFSDSANLQNLITGEVEKFKESTSKFLVGYKESDIPWVNKSNYRITTRFPKVIIIDENDNLATGPVYYHTYHEKEWHLYNRSQDIPKGLIYIRVDLPDGVKIDRFYNIGDLNFCSKEEHNQTTLMCNNTKDFTVLMAHHDNIDVIPNGNEMYLKRTNVQIFPDSLKIKICKTENPILEIDIDSPFKSLHIQRNYDDRSEIQQTEIISARDLNNYRIIQQGYPDAFIKLQYKGYDDKYSRDMLYYKIPIMKSCEMIYLTMDYINLLFYLNDHNFKLECEEQHNCIFLILNNKQYLIQEYATNAKFNSDGIIEIYGTAADKITNIHVAVRKPDETKFSTHLLQKDTEGLFKIEDFDENNEYIIFSEKKAINKIRPIRFCKELENKEKISKMLSKHDKFFWERILYSYSFSISNNLPFKLFTELFAISDKGYFVCQFLNKKFQLHEQEYLTESEDSLIEWTKCFYSDFDRFEKEMVFSIDWIKRDEWLKEVQNIEPTQIQNYFIFLQTLMEESNDKILEKYVTDTNKPTINNLSSMEFKTLRQSLSEHLGVDQNYAYQLPIYKFSNLPQMFPRQDFENLEPNAQKVLLHCTAYIIEYLIEDKHPDFWDKRPLRSIIRFYKNCFPEAYKNILRQTIKL